MGFLGVSGNIRVGGNKWQYYLAGKDLILVGWVWNLVAAIER